MEAARGLRPSLRASTYATLFGLLSVTGMRGGEAIALSCSDVDLHEGLLTVRGSKFGKSREIVLHSTTQSALGSYARERDATFTNSRSSSFFVSQAGNRLFRQNMHLTFLDLVRRAGMEDREVWQIRSGHEGVLYAGTQPAGLFKSEDSGTTWVEIESFAQSPEADQWCIAVDPPLPGRARATFEALYQSYDFFKHSVILAPY